MSTKHIYMFRGPRGELPLSGGTFSVFTAPKHHSADDRHDQGCDKYGCAAVKKGVDRASA